MFYEIKIYARNYIHKYIYSKKHGDSNCQAWTVLYVLSCFSLLLQSALHDGMQFEYIPVNIGCNKKIIEI